MNVNTTARNGAVQVQSYRVAFEFDIADRVWADVRSGVETALCAEAVVVNARLLRAEAIVGTALAPFRRAFHTETRFAPAQQQQLSNTNN